MSNALVVAQNVGKKYARSLQRSIRYGMRDVVAEMAGIRKTDALREDEFWAVRNIGFELERGQCLAILGGNGAGKSTLLKVISGILAPDTGRVSVQGRIEKMIELSSGMSPNLTGRQNVALRARMLGLSKRAAMACLDDIVDFAELGEFIDSPLKFYSSGMRARLGFATTVAMAPDVLIIDEVLAVGDIGFRMKCYERVDRMRSEAAVIMVSHSLNHVARMATTSLVLHKGQAVYQGAVQGGIAKYQDLMAVQKLRRGTFKPEMVDFSLQLGVGAPVQPGKDGSLPYGAGMHVHAMHRVDEPLHINVLLHEFNGPALVDWSSGRTHFTVSGGIPFEVDLGPALFCPGFYSLYLVGIGQDGMQKFMSEAVKFRVIGEHFGSIRIQPEGRWSHLPDGQVP